MKKAIYAFSGDPITFGHMDIIERASKVFDELIVGIGVNPSKKYLFTLEERTQLAQEALAKFKNVQVCSFKGLLVDFAYENDIPVIVRGLRNSEDFTMEVLLHQIGESQSMRIDTFFLPSRQQFAHISSGAAKAVQMEQGLIYDYVPLNVKQKLEERLSGQHIIGITGEIGAGKSFLAKELVAQAKQQGLEAHRIDIDKIGHEILEELTEPLFVYLRKQLVQEFGEGIKGENGFIDRKALGKILFSDLQKLKHFNELMYKPLLLRLRRNLYGKMGLIILDSALISETDMGYLCNNNVILVKTNREEQRKRLHFRGYTEEQIHARIDSQYSYEKKRMYLMSQIKTAGHGKIFYVENVSADKEQLIAGLQQEILAHLALLPEVA